MLFSSVLLVFAPLQLGTVRLDSPSVKGAVVASSLSEMKPTSSGSPEILQWLGEEKNGKERIVVRIRSLSPNPSEGARSAFEASLQRDEATVLPQGGQTIAVKRETYALRLTGSFDGEGGGFVESATGPVTYSRMIVATKGYVPQARAILAGLDFWDGKDFRTPMYGGAFPLGWKADFGDEKIALPYPAKEGKVGETALSGQKPDPWSVRDIDLETDSPWVLSKQEAANRESVVELAKRLPSKGNFGPDPRMQGADLVDWRGTKLLRQKGLEAHEEFEKEWVAFTTRDQWGNLHTAVLHRKKGGAWASTDFPVNAPGTPVAENGWSPAPGKFERTADLGDGARLSYTLWASPKVNGETTILFGTIRSSRSLRVGKTGAAALEGFRIGGATGKETMAKLGRDLLDVSYKPIPSGWWLMRHSVLKGEDGIPFLARTEVVCTVQKRRPFVLTMVGPDTESFQNECSEAILSLKGADDKPLFAEYPEGKVGTDYYLPRHNLVVTFAAEASPKAYDLGASNLFSGGYFLADEAHAMFSVNLAAPDAPGQDLRVAAPMLQSSYGKPKEFKVRRDGIIIVGSRIEWKDTKGQTRYLYTLPLGDGAYIHVLQPKERPLSWLAYYKMEKA